MKICLGFTLMKVENNCQNLAVFHEIKFTFFPEILQIKLCKSDFLKARITSVVQSPGCSPVFHFMFVFLEIGQPVDLGTYCGDHQQFCIGTMASEKEWESKRFSGDWKNFLGGGILSGSWQADSDV